MIRVVKTLAIHLCCIIIFAFFYYFFSSHFNNNRKNTVGHYNSNSTLDSFVDVFLLSTTIQAGVGVSDMLPISIYGKIIMILQQIIMISISVITIYVFTNY
jgi:hypothetical protein